jgi:hypothetical protein
MFLLQVQVNYVELIFEFDLNRFFLEIYLVHYYESVQPQMNHIISSSEGIIDHLTSENFIHIVENLSEYSIPCPVKEKFPFVFI